jgi:hypothetical protein
MLKSAAEGILSHASQLSAGAPSSGDRACSVRHPGRAAGRHLRDVGGDDLQLAQTGPHRPRGRGRPDHRPAARAVRREAADHRRPRRLAARPQRAAASTRRLDCRSLRRQPGCGSAPGAARSATKQQCSALRGDGIDARDFAIAKPLPAQLVAAIVHALLRQRWPSAPRSRLCGFGACERHGGAPCFMRVALVRRG